MTIASASENVIVTSQAPALNMVDASLGNLPAPPGAGGAMVTSMALGN